MELFPPHTVQTKQFEARSPDEASRADAPLESPGVQTNEGVQSLPTLLKTPGRGVCPQSTSKSTSKSVLFSKCGSIGVDNGENQPLLVGGMQDEQQCGKWTRDQEHCVGETELAASGGRTGDIASGVWRGPCVGEVGPGALRLEFGSGELCS